MIAGTANLMIGMRRTLTIASILFQGFSCCVCALVQAPGRRRHGTTMKEGCWNHHAVLLKEDAVLHDETDVSQRIQILKRISPNGNQISRQSDFDGTALLV